jgi:hypothetical protein
VSGAARRAICRAAAQTFGDSKFAEIAQMMLRDNPYMHEDMT